MTLFTRDNNPNPNSNLQFKTYLYIKEHFFLENPPPPHIIPIELMSLTCIDNTRLKLLRFVRWMDGKICCIQMALSYCITPGILLHVLHGPTYTLNINVQVYQSHFKLLRSLQILSISFTLRGPGEKDLLHMKYWLWYYQGRIYQVQHNLLI